MKVKFDFTRRQERPLIVGFKAEGYSCVELQGGSTTPSLLATIAHITGATVDGLVTQGATVRLRSKGAWAKRAKVLRPSGHPRSHDVTTEGRQLRRNRRHVLLTSEDFSPYLPDSGEDVAPSATAHEVPVALPGYMPAARSRAQQLHKFQEDHSDNAKRPDGWLTTRTLFKCRE
ncbi:hypothetical protein MRX96_024023 [Rhipicephalus microplus]